MTFTTTSHRGLFILTLLACNVASADTPLGWINNGGSSAYTSNKGELEINLGILAVNDTIDFINYRDDFVANDRRLVGDSGDLIGGTFAAHYGISEHVSMFLSRREHSLSIDLGTINSVNVTQIDDSLDTSKDTLGFKWTFYQSNLLNPDNRVSAAALEFSVYSGSSDDFDVSVDEIHLADLDVFFANPQTFSVAGLEDDGWKARVIYTLPVQETGVLSFWAGYGQSQARSGTTSDIASAFIKSIFEQEFELEETYLYAGASVRYQITPRIPLDINYEYINVSDSNLRRIPESPSSALPSFLSASAERAADDNHTLTARLSYWMTPKMNISLSGDLYSNQFLGIIPHYDNPLSGSFSSLPYGFAGVELGIKF